MTEQIIVPANKLPTPEREYYTLPESAKLLDISEYKLRTALTKGLIRSKRSSNAQRARFMFHRDWLAEYQRYQERPTTLLRVKTWFRKHF